MSASLMLKEIILCKHDTLQDRINLLNPLLIASIVVVLASALVSFFFNISLPVFELFLLVLSLTATKVLIKRFYYNPVLFLPSFSLLSMSIISMMRFPESIDWFLLQLLSMLIINVLGSTRCNAMIFFLIVISLAAPALYGHPVGSFLKYHVILWVIFPFLLTSSYYKSLQSINNILSLKQLHKLELDIIESSKNTQLAHVSSVVAHEIKNALAVLNGQLMLLRMQDSGLEEIIAKAEKSSDRILDIVSMIKKKTFSSLEQKKFNLSELIRDEVIFLKLSQEFADIDFDLNEIVDDIFIHANENEMTQVVTNLLTNASFAIKENQSHNRQKNIKIKLFHDQGRVVLFVSDNGLGIREEIKHKVFDPGFTTKEKGSGTGIGLFLIKKIVTSFKGKISFETSSEGTSFRLEFPSLS